jgi:hypothetical protein
MKFKLVNPSLKGDIETTFTGGSHLEAANSAYGNLSQYFNNYIPKFYFTLEDENEKMFHFYVKETREGDKADFTIKEYKVSAKYEKDLKKQVKTYTESTEQQGGKHSSSSSSSSSSDSWLKDDTPKTTYKVDPIVYWWYYPSVYRLRKFYVPTFVQSVTPILSVSLYPTWSY